MRKPLDGDIVRFSRQNVGGFGLEVIADDVAHTPAAASPLDAADLAFTAIVFTAASVLSALVSTSSSKSPITGDITTLTFPAGFTLFGNFASVTFASGAGVAYVGPSIA